MAEKSMLRNRLMKSDTMSTEKKYPVNMAAVAMCLLVFSLTIISDSPVVKPALVRRETAWKIDFSLGSPVILKSTAKILISA